MIKDGIDTGWLIDVIGPDVEVKYWNAVIVGGLFDHVKAIDAYNSYIKLEKKMLFIIKTYI